MSIDPFPLDPFPPLSPEAEAISRRAYDSLWGCLCGDALGVPYEFKSAATITTLPTPTLPNPIIPSRAHYTAPKNAWSDDGAQALALFEAATARRQTRSWELSREFAERLLKWQSKGAYACQGKVFDIGGQTSMALSALRRGVPPRESGGTDEHSNGNGSLMRAAGLPAGLLRLGDRRDVTDELFVQYALDQSLPTHAHPRTLLSSVWYCQTLWRLILGEPELALAWDDGAETARAVAQARGWLKDVNAITEYGISGPLGTGYSVSSLWSALKCCSHAETYSEAVIAAVKLGGDTDTTAAITGGMAGAFFGEIPAGWKAALRDADYMPLVGIPD